MFLLVLVDNSIMYKLQLTRRYRESVANNNNNNMAASSSVGRVPLSLFYSSALSADEASVRGHKLTVVFHHSFDWHEVM